ncbi:MULTISPECIES: ATP-binding cassette domain-containing protein [unclassified Pseudodesulfovibrio]|uniref:ATP-binding cassette domain-containing protein n=1 Tax=unclassified Pseudodesulfovibrio TaxID=2661612 RepID=UPI000FEB9001|nr:MULTISPECIES: ATP-binding cassette domain-containing protein [unclassified Pseudodesulfovibrio]MCJ2166217.1 ATP-binding cassette domain-containing protein [Pseudodesulfovibrio sp. S3-i]RWU02306.1 ATP-binding cassette domain-containing protein [Pseudodesulfovibrio sp. S3]
MHSLITLMDVSVTRSGKRLLGPLSWRLERGLHTAVTGRNGSGKTTLLRLLRGELMPDAGGERMYDFGAGPQRSVVGLRQRIGLVSPDMQEFYFLHAPRVSGRNVILAGFFDTPILYEPVTPEQEAAVDEIIGLLDIRELAESELRTLSTGQVRKLLVARALAPRPDVLLLDECLDGLDMVSRAEILRLLDMAVGYATLVCAAHRAGDLPDCIDRALVLDSGLIMAEGTRQQALKELRGLAPEMVACDLPVAQESAAFDYLLRMENVSVVTGGKRILHSVNWQVLPGENWIVLGDNGAGKSSLLKLITSEIAPYADDPQGVGVIQRLGGMTMDEARPLIGVVSPELQARYARELGWEVTAEETVMSGFRGSVGMLDEPTGPEKLQAQKWLEIMDLKGMGTRRLRHMSYGQQRRVFLARAMAPRPKLLLLDEPLSGLDPVSRKQMAGVIQRLAEAGTPFIMVTHHAEDRVAAINKVMVLEKGKQRFCGSRDEYETTLNMG